jgi:glycogen debranching enzyme
MRSTYDEQGLAKNDGVGHGWIEGGPLLPVKAEHYQVGLQVQSLRSLARLADATGSTAIKQQLEAEFAEKRPRADARFWSDTLNAYAYAVDANNKPLPTVSVLSTVPMWFQVTEEQRASRTIDVLARPDHHADWGMRILSDKDPRYDPTGYHFGSVWPLFTGWASVGQYKSHRADAAYANLRSNALLTFNGALGRVTEVMSGTFHEQLATSSPHQIWSSAMVISPIMRGMLGLESDQLARRLTLKPHVPAEWNDFAVTNIPACGGKVSLNFKRTIEAIELTATREGTGDCTFEFSPAVQLPSGINTSTMATVNGRTMQPRLDKTMNDMHARITMPLGSGTTSVRLRLTK